MMSRAESLSLRILAALLFLSGAAFAVSRYLLPHDDPFSVSGSWWEPWALKLHVLAAPGFVFMLGVILRRHVTSRLRDPGQSRRRSGLPLGLLLVALGSSGYALQVLTAETPRAVLSYTHLGLGLLGFVLWLAHARAPSAELSARLVATHQRSAARKPAWRA